MVSGRQMPGLGLAALLALAACNTTARNPAFQDPAAPGNSDAATSGTPDTPPGAEPSAGAEAATADGAVPLPAPTGDAGAPASDGPPGPGSADTAPLPSDASDQPELGAQNPDAGAEAPIIASICPADPDLVLCLRFEKNLLDESPHHHTAKTVSGVSYVEAPSPSDGEVGVFASASRVQFPYHAAMDVANLTIEATVLPRQLPTGNARMGLLDYTREYSLFLYPGGKLRCIVVLANEIKEIESATGFVAAGVSSHVACTVSDKTIGLWKDGVQVANVSISSQLKTGSGADTMVVGGNFSSDAPDPFDGQLDNLRIWRNARTGTACAGGFTCN
jgi:hypothetical protein